MVVLSFFDIRKTILLILPIVVIFSAIYVTGEVCSQTSLCSSLLSQGIIDTLGDISEVIEKFFIVFMIFLIFKIFEVFVRSSYGISFIKKNKKEDVNKMKTIFSVIWWTLFIFITLNVLIADFGQVVLSLGLVGFGLTFALQQPILNLVGWITIFFKGTYKENDRIEVVSGNGDKIRGDVIEIGLMTTTLNGLVGDSETKSQKTVSFPNQLVLTSELRNYSWDSNYILDELEVSITYESDLDAATKIIEKSVSEVVKKNKNHYNKKREEERIKVTLSLKKLLRELNNQENEKKRREMEREAKRLKEGVEKFEKEEKHLEELSDEFKPKMRIEMLDSSVLVIAQYLTPYTMVKRNRTEMNKKILDRVKETKNVEIAYPHLQIVK